MDHKIRKVNPRLKPMLLLSQTGFYDLESVAKHLEIPSARLKAIGHSFDGEGTAPGIIKSEHTWFIDMEVFSTYYFEKFHNKPRNVDDAWDGNTLLSKPGCFYLSEVVKKIPFNGNQLRHFARTKKDAKETMGIWKEDGVYLVDMPIFSNWIRDLWLEEC